MSNSFCKRIIPCLDVDNGRTVKGVKFQQLRDVGDPLELARLYESQGADELMFLDISATKEGRETMVVLVEKIARNLSIPFTVGGGIRSIAEVERLLDSGADKVSINSAAFKTPELLSEIAQRYGSQCCVISIDARRASAVSQPGVEEAEEQLAAVSTGKHAVPSLNSVRPNDTNSEVRWEALAVGGRVPTGKDAFDWAVEAVNLGAGEVLLTSWDHDGTRSGFDIALTKRFAEALPVPVIASGGASGAQSFIDVFEQASADAALAASIFHDGEWTVADLKRKLQESGVQVRL